MKICFIGNPLICSDLLLSAVVSVHIVVALDHAIVELTLLGSTAAEIMLKLRLGGDDILLPAVGELQVPSQGGVAYQLPDTMDG